MAIEACRIAIKYMVPVILLSDGYIANGSEPWRLPDAEELPDLRTEFATDPENFLPYSRDQKTLARPWAIPGTPGLEHRVGGLEKEDLTGNVSYDAENHEKMVHLRADKVARIADDIPPLEVRGDRDAELLVLGWGSTLGAITGGAALARQDGLKVACAHLRYLNPFPKGLAEALGRYRRVLIPEMNMGQMAFLIQGTFVKRVISYSKVQGQSFFRSETHNKNREILEADNVH